MANQRDIKRRINSVANTQKITKAMKLVAAAKFARAAHAVSASRPYSRALGKLVENLTAAAKDEITLPLVQPREGKDDLLVVVATDRGLCGGVNSNLFKVAAQWLQTAKQAGRVIHILSWGRKAMAWSKKTSLTLLEGREKVIDRPNYERGEALSRVLVESFLSGKYTRIFIAYNEFKSALSQQPTVIQFLPISLEEKKGSEAQPQNRNYLVEPKLEEIIDDLLKQKLAALTFQILLEAAASEHGSRMTAMDNATTNAGEVRKKLTLKYNRARQAAITKELIEIISGAQAL